VTALWHGGVVNAGKPYENIYACFMRRRDGQVEGSSCNDPWDRVKPGEC
jgi:ketosteroid isomerase-like protein